jgi:peptidoglycan/xylan/chitin deacetylase (PgdA/CDA1 family)
MKKIIITVDVEQDFPAKVKNGYLGVESLPQLLSILKQINIKATFFITADTCARYPEIMQQILDNGHLIGCHGYNHKELWFKTYYQQLKEIKKSTAIIVDTLGVQPKMFRAPRFSVNKNTIKALIKLNYEIDSSILPNHEVRMLKGIFRCHSHKNAPILPYYPSTKCILEKDTNSSLIEVPLTENPLLTGAPIGAGFLNKYGADKTLQAISMVKQDYVIFLIHPWELIDLSLYYPSLNPWVFEICSGNINEFEYFFKKLCNKYTICNLDDVLLK